MSRLSALSMYTKCIHSLVHTLAALWCVCSLRLGERTVLAASTITWIQKKKIKITESVLRRIGVLNRHTHTHTEAPKLWTRGSERDWTREALNGETLARGKTAWCTVGGGPAKPFARTVRSVLAHLTSAGVAWWPSAASVSSVPVWQFLFVGLNSNDIERYRRWYSITSTQIQFHAHTEYTVIGVHWIQRTSAQWFESKLWMLTTNTMLAIGSNKFISYY